MAVKIDPMKRSAADIFRDAMALLAEALARHLPAGCVRASIRNQKQAADSSYERDVAR